MVINVLSLWKTQHEKNMIGIGVGIFILMKWDSKISIDLRKFLGAITYDL